MATGTATRKAPAKAPTKRAPAKRAPARKAAPKPPPVVEEELDVEDEEYEDDELEVEDESEGDEDELDELDEDEVEEEAPKAKRKSTQAPVAFGVKDLVTYINKRWPDQKVDARGLRNLIRKLARDGSNRVDREIVPGNRERYDWGSVQNPEVKRIIKALLGGELEADKQEKLAKLKESQAAKKAAAAKLTGRKKVKARPKPVVAEVDEDDEELELDEDE